jgi:hypothetical protein
MYLKRGRELHGHWWMKLACAHGGGCTPTWSDHLRYI